VTAVRTVPFGGSRDQVSVIGQGTWQVRDAKNAKQAIEEGLRLGLTHIDTAELYERNSRSETMLGELLSRPDRDGKGTMRDHVFLASKVMPQHADRRGTVSACKDSLVHLQTDRLDLYYLHWPGRHPVADTMAAMGDLVDLGWIRHVGVSNFDVAQLEEARAALGPRRLAANQVLYHLADRGAESEVVPWCKAHGVTVVAYSPFGQGSFVHGPGLRALEAVAKREGLTARQAALAFLTRDPAVVAIPKAETVPHVRDNAKGDARLSEESVAAIDAAFPTEPGLRTV
jgi:diketogulonate reductase-like aldo/keto reductase